MNKSENARGQRKKISRVCLTLEAQSMLKQHLRQLRCRKTRENTKAVAVDSIPDQLSNIRPHQGHESFCALLYGLMR